MSLSKAKAEALSSANIRDAKVLKAHHARWIEKRALLRAIVNRCEKALDVIQNRLNPYIVAETENDTGHRAVVRVGKRIVEVKVVESERTDWEGLCRAALPEAQINSVRDGFTKESISPRAALLGLVEDVLKTI